jgi:vacuolar-type H+-ATPase subunit I/STV1
MRPLGTRIIFELILGVVLVSSLVLILGQKRRIAVYQRQQEADAQNLRLLQQALQRQILEKLPPPVTEELPPPNEAGIVNREAVIARLDRELAQTRANLADLQSQLSSANDQNAKALADAQQRLQKQQTDSQAQLDDLQKKLDAALAQSDIARQRSAALEADNTKLKADAASVGTRAADAAHIISNLQDLNQRRDLYLTAILRRYRDITGEFRAMTGMLDTSRDGNSGPCGGAVVGRIQTAVTSAEDDMRQVNELNARSQKLEKQLLAK